MGGTTILISPLNWGFGHAGRMIPLALELKKRGNEVVFGADAQLLPLIENELPGIRKVEIPGMRIRYSRFLPQYFCIFMQLPVVVISSFREHFALRRIVKDINPSVIISDNRFGLFHRSIFSVYVTHQLRIPFPRSLRFMEPFAAWLHRLIISRYDLCLVPDYPGPVNLSGRLSHGLKLPVSVHYMGPLSRFRMASPPQARTILRHPYCCLILSGPEPQRSMLLEKVTEALRGIQLCVLSTAPVKMIPVDDPLLTCIIRPDTGTMRQLIEGSSLIITRAGYTSVMELVSLGRGAVLIPTPGQPEQEYLGDWLNGHHGFMTISQNNIKNLLNNDASASPANGSGLSDNSRADEYNLSDLNDSGPMIEADALQLPGGTPPVITTTRLPDSSDLFNQAINLLCEQKIE